jgi:hypothetical protein
MGHGRAFTRCNVACSGNTVCGDATRCACADIMLSAANWAPGLYGPGDSWEKRVAETDLALFVNNRNGREGDLDMKAARSMFIAPSQGVGTTLFEHQSQENSLLLLKYDLTEASLIDAQLVELPNGARE